MKTKLSPAVLIFCGISLAYFSDCYNFCVVLPAIPRITHSLHFPEYVGRFFLLFCCIGAALGALFNALIFQRQYSKSVLLAANIIVIIGGVLGTISYYAWMLWLAQLLIGLGTVVSYTALTVIAANFSGDRNTTTKYLSYASYFSLLASLIAPILGGVFADALNWRVTFVSIIVLTVLQLLLFLKVSKVGGDAKKVSFKSRWQHFIKAYRLPQLYLWATPFVLLNLTFAFFSIVVVYIFHTDLHLSAHQIGLWLAFIYLWEAYGRVISPQIATKFQHFPLISILCSLALACSLLLMIFSYHVYILSIALPMAGYLLVLSIITPITRTHSAHIYRHHAIIIGNNSFLYSLAISITMVATSFVPHINIKLSSIIIFFINLCMVFLFALFLYLFKRRYKKN